MKTSVVGIVLLLVLAVPVVYGQTAEESVDSNESAASTETVEAAAEAAPATPTTTGSAPGWVHMVRVAALAGPFAFLVLAWVAGGYMHHRLVRREQEQFPAIRGTRAPQWVPMTVSGALFFIPAILFLIFEILSRRELRLGTGGVVDEWQPVTERAWLMLVVCLVLALVPWLFARRADSVS